MLQLEGSCYCQAVTFSVLSHTPYPYMRCYCSFCRVTSGSGGYGVNIMADAETLQVSGEACMGFHHGKEHDKNTDELKDSPGGRHFCRECGSPLWVSDPRWAEWIYPYASAILTPLPEPPEYMHIMLDFKPAWIVVPQGPQHKHFPRYPDEAIEDWHHRHGLYIA